MLHNTKTNKKLFALVASSLLGASLLAACGSNTPSISNIRNNGTAIAQTNPNPTSQNNNPTSQNNNESAQPSNSVSNQNLVSVAESAKPAVVQVVSYCTAQVRFNYNGQSKVYDVSAGGSGSGFFVNSDGYIVTNAHVVEIGINRQQCRKALYENYIQRIAEDFGQNPQELLDDPQALQEINNNSNFGKPQLVNEVILPDGDKLPFEIKEFGASVGEGKDVAVIKVETKDAPILKLADSEKVKALDKIIVMGYPDVNPSILNEKSLTEVTINSGEISNANKKLNDGSPVFQISAPVTYGSSGGPVLNEKGEVIGITTFGTPGKSQQAFAFTSNTVMEFVRQAGASNE